MFRSKSKKSRERETYKRSAEKEQWRRKIDRCQEGAGLGVTRKMGLIPPPIPAAFLLFELTSGLNFPFCTEHRGSLLGGWKRVSGPLLPPRLNTSKYRTSMSHWTRHCTIPDPESVLITPWWLMQAGHSCDTLANACFDWRQMQSVYQVQKITAVITPETRCNPWLISTHRSWRPARRKSRAHESIGPYTKGCNTDETVWAASLWGNI